MKEGTLKSPGNIEVVTIVEQSTCPVREVLDRVGDKWTVLIVVLLDERPHRFNELRRRVEGISQRMLTVTLRRLERDGLVLRTVTPSTPPQVEYSLTDLGRTLTEPIELLMHWANRYRSDIQAARIAFDERHPDDE